VDLTCYNLGLRRDTIRDIHARWREETSRRLPSWEEARLVFSCGANDITVEQGQARVPLAESLANCRAVLTEARHICPTLMVGPPPFADAHAERLGGLSAQIADVCAHIDVPFLDIWTPLMASDTFVRETAAGDGAHPAAGGYGEIARLVQGWPAWKNWFQQGEASE
jgi:lysophospholipase L1-like esterase